MKKYRSGFFFGQTVHALRGIDLEVPEGGIFGLLGPNGAGKTTLIKTLLGIVRPTSGRALVFGKPHSRRATRQDIGYLPENFQVARHHTGISALYFLGRLSLLTDAEIKKRAPRLLELVGLRGREKELVRTYSKGMKQRLGIAQALLHEPKLVFLDEPTDGLDPLGRHHVRQCIEQMRNEGKTVFLNSHILQEVELICDRFAIMAKGNVAASGTLAELLERAESINTNTTIEVIGSQTSLEMALLALQGIDRFTCERMENKQATADSQGTYSEIETGGSMSQATEVAVKLAPSQEQHKLTINTVRPMDIDLVVDLLRKHQLSIVNLAVHRPKLEQIFMQLVQEPHDPTNSLAN